MGPQEVRRKTLILLTEGLVEEIVYSSMLEKLYGGRQVECEDAPTPLEALIDPLIRRAKCYTLEHGDLIVIVNSRGYENLRNTIRQLLTQPELPEALGQLDLRIAVAADRDKNPTESIRGVLSSMGLQATGGDTLTVELGNGAKLAIHVIEQGGEGDTATGEIEDELRKLVETLKPELQHAAKKVEEIYGPLTDKQKLLIYLALLERKPKIRELYELFREAVAAASRDAIEHLGLAKGLGKALG
ncbi:hypothetical protein [Pyrobaculum calidifontis]|uniref:hypothetical protein n=1 Tax=Pyrobaculum calidifontis TaxID=181486 RepID=UPI00032150DF|nr:hypothetical protein [Pyrobaculum calidifontis]